MLASYFLSLREGVEAALILGIIFSALRKVGRSELNRALWAGAGAALTLSILVAVLLDLLGAELDGTGEAIFEGLTMLAAAGLLTGMIFWMQRQSRGLRGNLEMKISTAAGKEGRLALFMVAFLAVVREGVELAFYLLAARLATNPIETLAGSILGLGSAALLGWTLLATTHRLSMQLFFRITNVLLLFFAAGLVGLGVHALNEAGWIPALIDPLWNLNIFLPESSAFGQALRSLFGYTAAPSFTSMAAYAVYLAALAVILFRPRSHSLQERS
jgi:high-affinity iron transporter